MEFGQKLQELRRQNGLTQEALARALFVSRTAVSKWESGRGCPSIDSLQQIAAYFNVTTDDLLSKNELLSIAQQEQHAVKARRMRDLAFGLMDCSFLLLLFVPLFGQRDGAVIRAVSLLSLTAAASYVRIGYFAFVFLSALSGIAALTLQNCTGAVWLKSKRMISVLLSILGVLIFTATLQPYAASFTLLLLLVKGILLLKRL